MANKGLLIGILGALGLGWFLSRRAASGDEPGGEGEGGGDITLTIIPAQSVGRNGRSVAGLPATIVEGSTGNIAQLSLRNTTVYAGTTQKTPYIFKLRITIAAGVTLLNIDQQVSLAADELKTLSFSFNVPFGVTANYAATAWIMNTGGSAELGRAPLLSGPIGAAQVTPGGTISW